MQLDKSKHNEFSTYLDNDLLSVKLILLILIY